jgi:hypothetical protein
MMQASESGPLALPRDHVIGRAAFSFDADTEPMAAPGVTRRPADVVQARLFEQILKAEITQLEQRADAMAYRWWSRRDRVGDRPPAELVELRRRIGEVRGLLQTLEGRFPRARG